MLHHIKSYRYDKNKMCTINKKLRFKGGHKVITATEIIALMNEKKLSIKGLKKQGYLTVSAEKASAILKAAGYNYNSLTQQWEQRDTFQNELSTQNNIELLPAVTTNLNKEELDALKQLAQQLLAKNREEISFFEDPDFELYSRSKSLEKEKSTRKTYIVSESLASRFDAVSDRSKIDKSDLLAIAFHDFLKKYE